jgi:hypothetical protein
LVHIAGLLRGQDGRGATDRRGDPGGPLFGDRGSNRPQQTHTGRTEERAAERFRPPSRTFCLSAVPDRPGPGRTIGQDANATVAPTGIAIVMRAAWDATHFQGHRLPFQVPNLRRGRRHGRVPRKLTLPSLSEGPRSRMVRALSDTHAHAQR